MDDALKFGHDTMSSVITPVVGVSTLLELMVFNELKSDGEVDFFINGDKLNEETIEKIKTLSGFHSWENEKAILYFHDPKGTQITYVPYYMRDKAYANIRANEYFVWKKKHFTSLQTKTYKGNTYNIPHDPIGYLEEYYGKPWDDFDGRKGWHWHDSKNLQTLKHTL